MKNDSMLLILGVAALLFFAESTQSIFSAVGTSQATVLSTPYKAGDTFSSSFVLMNTDMKTLPETSDIAQTTLWTAYTIRDAGNNILLQPAAAEITTPLVSGGITTVDVSYVLLPNATTGKYIAFAVLFSVPQVYDATTNTFVQGKEKILDKKAVSFNVVGVRPPTINIFQQFLDSISDFFAKIFGG